ncbi:MAG: hypothetical protein E7311_00740 [Clostridiales bacterium]|nr:hypothetical protein [Clostridiales bacterium]
MERELELKLCEIRVEGFKRIVLTFLVITIISGILLFKIQSQFIFNLMAGAGMACIFNVPYFIHAKIKEIKMKKTY